MHHRRAFLTTTFALALSTSLPAVADDVTYDKLFFIQRSKNANEVHYDARVTKAGTLDPKDPMVGYWINKAEDNSRSPITTLQKIAYGYDCDPAKDGQSWNLKLKAFKERPMWVQKAPNGKWRVRTTIAGKDAFMSRLYVATDESGVMPKVLYVDVFGEETGNGAAVQEHIVKN
ncbi:MAG: DUF4833 domain-containing protein [Minicystis sp.]